MDVLLLGLLILLNGAFAMSELALVSARKARLQALADEGDTAARAAIVLGEDPTRFLSTVQIGITSIGVLNGIVGESALADPLALWLQERGAPQPWSGYAATALVVMLITYLSIVVGELVPKRLGQMYPEAVARLVARPVDWLASATKPFVWLLTRSTQVLLRMSGVRSEAPAPVTQEEIHAMLAEGTSVGVLDEQEHSMLRNLLRLDERTIQSLMVPRSDVASLHDGAGPQEVLDALSRDPHRYYPVVRGSLSDVRGLLDARAWLAAAARGEAGAAGERPLVEPLYVPETLTGLELLENFRSARVQLALVTDEYGDVQGLVTIRDLLEAITGELEIGNAGDASAVQREDGSWLLDGHLPVDELKDRLVLKELPEEGRGRYHTLSGLIMLLAGRMPAPADSVEWCGWRLEVVDMDGRSIDKVLARRVAPPPRPGGPPAG